MPPPYSALAAALRRPLAPPPSPSRPAPTPPSLVALSAAYSLFLLRRASAPSAPRPPPRLLPVTLDLRAPHAVVAEHRAADLPPAHARRPAPWQVDLASASDLRARKRDVVIVTTAAIPWMTGTSVNPALRAIYLAKDGHRVTLVVPWLPTVPEQRRVFAKGCPTFERREDHAAYIERWVREQVPTAVVRVLFYEGVYAHDFGSILPVGAITDIFAPMNVVKDVCILEEPEHLTWHHSGTVWTELFNIVIGIIHTNYVEYANGYGFFGPQRAMALLFLNVWVCRGYCHRVIKLSDAVQQFPNSVTCNVHGVRDKFIHVGRHRKGGFGKGAYFMGKVLWAKGYRDLVDNMLHHYREKGYALRIHFYGSGPDAAGVQAEIDAEPALAAVAFDPGVADPLGANLRQYKVFVNASRSDVLCTATAEALAMGKLVVCLKHPSNEFFSTFPNCITYRTPAEFSDVVEDALRREPAPLSELDAYRLTWEAATERLYDAVRLPLSKSKPSKVGIALANVHASLSKIYPQPGKVIRIANSACLPADAG